MSDGVVEDDIDPTVRDHFIKIGEVLSHYRSGKIPKGFKAAPSFANWQQVCLSLRLILTHYNDYKTGCNNMISHLIK